MRPVTSVLLAASFSVAGCGPGTGPGEDIASAVPDTDIFLLSLRGPAEIIDKTTLVNVSDRDGYDNQPSFLPDEDALLYSSVGDDLQADVYRYDIGTGSIEQVTATPESEYSPTALPEGGGFSVVRVEKDGAQRLWSFDARGESATLELPHATNVGYHAWMDERSVLLFLVEEPPRLVLMDRDTGISRLVASNVGRSIHHIPGRNALSFIDLDGPQGPMIVELSVRDFSRTPIVAPVGSAQDYTWLDGGTLAMADGRRIYRATRRSGAWRLWADLEDLLPGPITRLAVSEDGDYLAVVASRQDRD